ncbi:MAG: hypothetical protein HS114_00685 [Anaerolineales bacterium]|nr:hypothetical protein [Anaerolineales bacterium]
MRTGVNGIAKPVRNNFTARCKLLFQEVPHFGELMKVRANGTFNLFGLIYDVIVQDDPLVVRQLILADVLEPELVLDQRENRLASIELSILDGWLFTEWEDYSRVAAPAPLNLDSLAVYDEAELRAFTDDLTYLRLVLNAMRVPTDELLVST